MKQFLLLIILILIIILFQRVYENFDIVSDTEYKTFESSYKSDEDESQPSYLSNLTQQYQPNVKCCLIQKNYVEDSNNEFGGNFKYQFKKMENENCDSKLYNPNSNQQLFFNGENGWNNINCDENKNILGSCRQTNKECIDFVTKEFCDKYKMTWSERTCQNQLDFKWEDKTRIPLPELKDDGTFVMFKRWN
jgi:hypothetical protein